jgi:hypothetical protein
MLMPVGGSTASDVALAIPEMSASEAAKVRADVMVAISPP